MSRAPASGRTVRRVYCVVIITVDNHESYDATPHVAFGVGPPYVARATRSELVMSGQRITDASGKLIGVAPRSVIEDMSADNELVGLGHLEKRAQATRDGLGGPHE